MRDVLSRYGWNVRVCEAFYPLLHALEIVLRNRLFAAGEATYPLVRFDRVPCWLDAVPSPLDPRRGARSVSETKARHGPSIASPDELVSRLDFGFWTGLFDTHYLYRSRHDRRLWPHALTHVFPSATPMPPLRSLRSTLNDLRHLRNRVFHHEPVWRRDLAADRERILALIGWMDADAGRAAAALDRLPSLLDARARRTLRVSVRRAISG